MTETSIYAELRGAEGLPSPKGVALEIMRAVEKEDTSMADLAQLVEKDPAISARLLKTANSPVNGVPVKITTARDAASRLGIGCVKSIAVALSLLSDNRKGACEEFDYDRFWSESLALASGMRRIAARVRTVAPDEAFTYGLLGLIGRLGLVSVYPERYLAVLREIEAREDLTIEKAEFEQFAIRADQLSARMMVGWGMRRYYEAIGEPKPGMTALRFRAMMRLAAAVSQVMLEPAPTPDILRDLAKTAAIELDFDPAELAEVFDEIVEDWGKAGHELKVETRTVPPLREIFAQAKAAASA